MVFSEEIKGSSLKSLVIEDLNSEYEWIGEENIFGVILFETYLMRELSSGQIVLCLERTFHNAESSKVIDMLESLELMNKCQSLNSFIGFTYDEFSQQSIRVHIIMEYYQSTLSYFIQTHSHFDNSFIDALVSAFLKVIGFLSRRDFSLLAISFSNVQIIYEQQDDQNEEDTHIPIVKILHFPFMQSSVDMVRSGKSSLDQTFLSIEELVYLRNNSTKKKGYDKCASNIFSFGSLLLHLLTMPYSNQSIYSPYNFQIEEQILMEQFNIIASHFPKHVLLLLEQLLKFTGRLKPSEILTLYAQERNETTQSDSSHEQIANILQGIQFQLYSEFPIKNPILNSPTSELLQEGEPHEYREQYNQYQPREQLEQNKPHNLGQQYKQQEPHSNILNTHGSNKQNPETLILPAHKTRSKWDTHVNTNQNTRYSHVKDDHPNKGTTNSIKPNNNNPQTHSPQPKQANNLNPSSQSNSTLNLINETQKNGNNAYNPQQQSQKQPITIKDLNYNQDLSESPEVNRKPIKNNIDQISQINYAEPLLSSLYISSSPLFNKSPTNNNSQMTLSPKPPSIPFESPINQDDRSYIPPPPTMNPLLNFIVPPPPQNLKIPLSSNPMGVPPPPPLNPQQNFVIPPPPPLNPQQNFVIPPPPQMNPQQNFVIPPPPSMNPQQNFVIPPPPPMNPSLNFAIPPPPPMNILPGMKIPTPPPLNILPQNKVQEIPHVNQVVNQGVPPPPPVSLNELLQLNQKAKGTGKDNQRTGQGSLEENDAIDEKEKQIKKQEVLQRLFSNNGQAAPIKLPTFFPKVGGQTKEATLPSEASKTGSYINQAKKESDENTIRNESQLKQKPSELPQEQTNVKTQGIDQTDKVILKQESDAILLKSQQTLNQSKLLLEKILKKQQQDDQNEQNSQILMNLNEEQRRTQQEYEEQRITQQVYEEQRSTQQVYASFNESSQQNIGSHLEQTQYRDPQEHQNSSEMDQNIYKFPTDIIRITNSIGGSYYDSENSMNYVNNPYNNMHESHRFGQDTSGQFSPQLQTSQLADIPNYVTYPVTLMRSYSMPKDEQLVSSQEYGREFRNEENDWNKQYDLSQFPDYKPSEIKFGTCQPIPECIIESEQNSLILNSPIQASLREYVEQQQRNQQFYQEIRRHRPQGSRQYDPQEFDINSQSSQNLGYSVPQEDKEEAMKENEQQLMSKSHNPLFFSEFSEFLNKEALVKQLIDQLHKFPQIKKICYNNSFYEGQILKIDKRVLKHGYGVHRMNNGDLYCGYFKNNEMDGQGAYFYNNGDIYSGQLTRNLRQGQGIFYYHSQNTIYSGDWEGNVKQGYGRLLLSQGEKYEGYFKQNVKCGRGMYYFANGDTFDGEWVYNKKCGQGTLEFQDGSVFHGNFYDDVPYGQGKMQYTNGDQYQGNYENGLITGYGVYIHTNSQYYEGDFTQNQMNGEGIYYFKNGDKYQGSYNQGQREGYGKYSYNNGCIYEGYWKNNQKEGEGKYIFPDGTFYLGSFQNSLKSGLGKQTFKDDEFYTGQWKNDKRNGQGVYQFKNQSYYEGEWLNDKMCGEGTYFLKVNNGFDKIYGIWKDDELYSSIQ